MRIMRESYACGLKTSISRIKDNFQRLTHKSRQLEIVLNTLCPFLCCNEIILKHAKSVVF